MGCHVVELVCGLMSGFFLSGLLLASATDAGWQGKV